MKSVPLTEKDLKALGLTQFQTEHDTISNFKLTKVGNYLKLKKYSRLHAKSFIHKKRPRFTSYASLGNHDHRPRRKDNIHRAKSRLVDLTRCNHTPLSWFLTWTYEGEQTNRDIVKLHIQNAIRRLERHLCRSVDYIYVLELQQRGTWHVHLLFFNIPYYSNEDWASMFWQKGFCKRSKVRNTDVAFYLAKYLGKDEQTDNYQRTYSCSQGLKQPEEIEDMLVAYRLLLAYAHAHTKWSLSEEIINPYTKSTTRYADIYPPPN